METGIRIGGADKHSLSPLTDSIVRIMSAPADQKTIRYALELLGRAADSSHITLRDVSIVGEKHEHFHHEPETSTAEDATVEAGVE